MKWKIEYLKAAQRDLQRLNPYNRKLVLKAIDKTAQRPLPPPEGIGKPLSNRASASLSGFYKIKLRILGYRVVYQLIREGEVMQVIVISIRDDDAVYREAERRIRTMEL